MAKASKQSAVKPQEKLNILMVSSECVPFAKTGGLGDVVGSLPIALKKLGHDVRVVIPKYGFIDSSKYKIRYHHGPMGVWMGDREEWCVIHETTIGDGVPVYLVEFNLYFERSGIYHDSDFNDYLDNPKRFSFLSRAALQLSKDLDFHPDIVHANDWQTALLPAYLKTWHWNDPVLGKAASVLTIHNIAYQGIYPKLNYPYIGLGESNFTWDKLECFGYVNFLKGGVVFADALNTVSPTYALETKTADGGYGLAPYLNDRGGNYYGILNGVDYSDWDPATDKLIPANYSSSDMSGKLKCKRALQKKLDLEPLDDIPIVGVVSRFVSQKGLDLLAERIVSIVQDMKVQFAVLGYGDKGLEWFYGGLPARHGGKIGAFVGYNNELAHLIEAGCDFFLMPSLYEPCGLNQLYSMKYGTLPIVRATGGLEDSVENYNEKTGEGTGFKYHEPSSKAIYYTVGWAVSTYYDRKEHLKKMIQSAMAKDFSWEKSAKEYEKLYDKAIRNKKSL
jgi:starch synthase